MSRYRSATLLTLIIASFGAMFSAGASHADTPAPSPAAQARTTTPIKHFLFLMQQNHSFDNYFGTYPGADGIPAGTCMPKNPADPTKGCVASTRVGNRAAVGLLNNPISHDAQYNNGKMDGFVSAFGSDAAAGEIAMAYYDDQDLPYYWNIAGSYVLFDRFFSSARGGSVRNHMFWVSGVPGSTGPRDAVPSSGWADTIPTIFDRLEAAGISWKFYIQNYDPTINIRSTLVGDKGAQVIWAPLLAIKRFLDNPALSEKIVDISQYYDDLNNNTLPSVVFMVPSGSSEHPPGSIHAGQAFVRSLISGLMRSSSWDTSAFLWTYDNSGGFYDHVPPPSIDEVGYGFRVPALLVSPYAKTGFIDHTTLDSTSGIAFIRDNWGVQPLAARDAAANSFMDAFDFIGGPREPVLLSDSRITPQVQEDPSSVVYPAYAFTLLIPIVIVAGTVRRSRRAPTQPRYIE